MDEFADLLDLEQRDPDGLLEAFVGTCDAGNCDIITSAVVWFEEEGRWISTCYGHAIKEMARPFLPE